LSNNDISASNSKNAKKKINLNSLSDFRDHCFYSQTTDSQFPTLTCRQILFYAAQMQSGDDKATINARIDRLLKLLGLEGCQNTKAGGYIGIKGLSGGQKKRLSLGVGLLKNPDVLYLDEPTSGLDAAAAYHVMKTIQEIAQTFNVAVVCSLQQPSKSVLDLVDHLLLLTSGEVAYSGPRTLAIDYFGTLGHICGTNQNPADFLLNTINADFVDNEVVSKIVKTWSSEGMKKLEMLLQKKENSAALVKSTSLSPEALAKREENAELLQSKSKATLLSQTSAVLRRDIRVQVLTDPFLYIARLILYWIMSAFLCVLWIKGRSYTNENLMSRLWPLALLMTVTPLMGLVVVYFFNNTWHVVGPEIKNGYYG